MTKLIAVDENFTSFTVPSFSFGTAAIDQDISMCPLRLPGVFSGLHHFAVSIHG